jgi:hypothetical protein
LPPASLTPVANLPPVSLIPAAILPPVSLTPVIPVVHLDLRLSPRIFEKIRNGPNAILWGWGETDSSKKPEAKNLVTLSLKIKNLRTGDLSLIVLLHSVYVTS